MDDDDADYMQGSDDEVAYLYACPILISSATGLRLRLFGRRGCR